MNHSHGYEMRLQEGQRLAREERERKRVERQKREAVQVRLDRLVRTLSMIETLPAILAEYEATGDHDHSMHGTRPLPVGAPCPGGDCIVDKARKVIAALGLKRDA